MRYFALATDYDGTLALAGVASGETIDALQRLKNAGLMLLLVTGRDLEDLKRTFSHLPLFDRVVAENGAIVFDPASDKLELVSDQVPAEFLQALRARGVSPLVVGRVIVATREPNDVAVLDTIRALGLELQVIFNKGAVMVLPSGVNKATGLRVALSQLKLSAHNVVGVGDGENDHAFIEACELSVAVASAVSSLKARADLVTRGESDRGLQELAGHLIARDLPTRVTAAPRHDLVIGDTARGRSVALQPHVGKVLLAGTSGAGKSRLAKTVLQQLTDAGYQYCVIDPEGDYEDFEAAVTLGNRDRTPDVQEILAALEQPSENLVVNLLGIPLDQRPSYTARLLAALLELQVRTGRPHWLILDEAHHLFPANGSHHAIDLLAKLGPMLFITVVPAELNPEVLSQVDAVLALGASAADCVGQAAGALREPVPLLPKKRLEDGEAVLWRPGAKVTAFRFFPSRFEHHRHKRKYAEGDLGDDRSFYFRGPKGRLNLKAQNLLVFSQIAEGVDIETWTYHLRRDDYRRWFAEVIKDDELAGLAAEMRRKAGSVGGSETREAIRRAIANRYTLPAA